MKGFVPPEWVQILFPIFFAAVWCLACLQISWASGWRQLAKRYRCSDPVSGKTWRFQSAGMRHHTPTNYGSCVKVTANESGIWLSVFFPFRLGHPPLFLPWSEFHAAQILRFYFFKRVRLTFPQEPLVYVELSRNLAWKIEEAIGRQWFEEANE